MASTLSNLNAVSKGRIGRLIKRLRSQGKTYDEIVDALRDREKVRVSRDTVRVWCNELEAVKGQAS